MIVTASAPISRTGRRVPTTTLAIVAAGDTRIGLARAITTSGHCPDYTSNAHAGR